MNLIHIEHSQKVLNSITLLTSFYLGVCGSVSPEDWRDFNFHFQIVWSHQFINFKLKIPKRLTRQSLNLPQAWKTSILKDAGSSSAWPTLHEQTVFIIFSFPDKPGSWQLVNKSFGETSRHLLRDQRECFWVTNLESIISIFLGW